MKKLFYLTSISFLVLCLSLGIAQHAFGQTKPQQILPKDSISHAVQGSSFISPLAISIASNHPSFSEANEPTTTPNKAQSILTGPGKVVVCIVILSCLFFYFNRKK